MSVSRVVKQNCSASSQWTRVSTILPSLFQHSLLPSARYHGDERRIKERTDCREMKIFSNGKRERERDSMRAVNERSRKSSPRLAAACTVSKILLRFTDDPRLLRGNKNWIKTAKEEEKKKEKECIYLRLYNFVSSSRIEIPRNNVYIHRSFRLVTHRTPPSILIALLFIFENGGYETGTIRTPPNRGSDC